MKKILGFSVVIFLTSMIFAEGVSCENENGSCVFNEDGSYECLCSEDSWGEGTGVAGSPVSDEDVTMPTQDECLEMVNEMCALPEGAVQCENVAGECYVMEDGDYWCDCYDGTGTGSGDSEPGDPGEEPSVDPDETEVDDGGSDETPPPADEETEPAPAEECESDDDCDEGFFCKEGYCYDGYYEFEECESNADCRIGYVCYDGYCYEKDSEKPDKEVPECETLLKETCGTEAPDLNKICSEEALEFCADGFALYAEKCEEEKLPAEMIEEIKEGTWNEIAPDIVDCCNEYSYVEKELKEMIECIKTKDCDECMKEFEEVVGEYDDEGDSGSQAGDDTGDSGDSGDGTNEEGENASETPKDSSDDSSDGCSLTLI